MTLVHVDELPIILNLYGRFKAVPRGSPLLLDIDWVEARVRPSQRKRLLGPRGGGLLVRDALLAAGILKPPNLREVLGVVADCISEAPPGKPLPCVLCLDTNVFYNMFLTLLEEELGRLPRLVASSCISRELAGRLEAYKAQRKMLVEKRGLVDSVKNAFSQAPPLKGDVLVAYHEYLKYLGSLEVVSKKECRGDEDIVRTYARLKEKFRPVFVTFDDAARGYALAYGLDNVLVQTPSLPGSALPATHRRVQRLLYVATMLHGEVELKGDHDVKLRVPSRLLEDAARGFLEVDTGDRELLRELERLPTYREISRLLERRPGA